MEIDWSPVYIYTSGERRKWDLLAKSCVCSFYAFVCCSLMFDVSTCLFIFKKTESFSATEENHNSNMSWWAG
jgi:hypothetical protein